MITGSYREHAQPIQNDTNGTRLPCDAGADRRNAAAMEERSKADQAFKANLAKLPAERLAREKM